MKVTPRSTTRRSTASAFSRFVGQPHTPEPHRRIAPKPRRCTRSSPPNEKVPERAAFAVTMAERLPLARREACDASIAESAIGMSRPNLQPASLAELRHTAAHVLAYAVQDLFPDAKPTIGPAIENGFYYDFDRLEPFTPEDLERLEKRMHEIVAANYEMTGREVKRDEALARFKGNPYKTEIASEIPEGEPITLYTIGEFTDLCRGGHVDHTGDIGALKLMSVAGAYWRGDEHNPMLQRIYGTAWKTQEELDAHLKQIE